MDELCGKLQKKKLRNRQNCPSHSVDNRVLQLWGLCPEEAQNDA